MPHKETLIKQRVNASIQRRRAEEMLWESEENYRELFNNSGQIF